MKSLVEEVAVYLPEITVQDGPLVKVYSFTGATFDRWKAVKMAAQAVPGVERIDGDDVDGMWVSFESGADLETADEAILKLIRAELPDDVPFRRIPFLGYHP